MNAEFLKRMFLAAVVVLAGGCGSAGDGLTSTADGPNAKAHVAADYTNVIESLYVAYYGRPADPAGLAFWAGFLASNGGTAAVDLPGFTASYYEIPAVRTVLDNFGNSAESIALYGTNNATIVNAIYLNLFNRAPDAGGLAFYTNGLNAGLITTALAAANIAGGASSTDNLIIRNKVSVATGFTAGLATPQMVAAYDGLAANARIRSGLATVGTATNVSSATQVLLDALLGYGGTYSCTFAGRYDDGPLTMTFPIPYGTTTSCTGVSRIAGAFLCVAQVDSTGHITLGVTSTGAVGQGVIGGGVATGTWVAADDSGTFNCTRQ